MEVKLLIYIFFFVRFRYVVLTSKHHDGYALWPSKYSFGWNSMDIGPHRDLVGEFANAIRINTTLKFGLYHSFFEWFNPMYLSDKQKSFTENSFVVNKVSIQTIFQFIPNKFCRWQFTLKRKIKAFPFYRNATSPNISKRKFTTDSIFMLCTFFRLHRK